MNVLIQHKLIESCLKQDRKAQLKLYNLYCDGMFIVAKRFLKDTQEAEDAMQESFIKAFTKLHQFNGEVSFGAWLKKIVIHKCLDKLKAKKLEVIAINEHMLENVQDQEDWSIDDGVTIEDIKHCISQLPERYKYALMLYLIEGYDHEEISEILSISQVASRTLLHRGKKMIQQEFKNHKNGTGS